MPEDTTMNPYIILQRLFLSLFLLVALAPAMAQEGSPDTDSRADAGVATSVEELKKQVIELNRDLFILEEDLLFPASSQFVVFLSLDAGEFLQLDSVKLKVNGTVVASHLYTERQARALQRGAMQRLYMGNLKTGDHEVTAFVEGIGPEDRAYKKAASFRLNKDTGTKTLEIRIQDQSADYQPAVDIVEWQ